jgi:tRNA(fMet)-specific endonuclease VapC
MTYLLDTNIVIALLNGHPLIVRAKLKRAASSGAMITVSSVTLYELWYGVAKSGRRRENTERINMFLAGGFAALAFDDEDAVVAGDIRAVLETAGTPIGPYDILIAAQARRHDATLVTANVREFARVKGLKWEDWARTR